MIWALLAVLLFCSGCVSASETALFGLPRQALYRFGKSSNPLRRSVFTLMRRPQTVLMTILITNTAVNVAIFAVSFVVSMRLQETSGAIAAAVNVGMLIAVILFGEMLPKALALRNAEPAAPFAAAITLALKFVLAPLRVLLDVLLVKPVTRLLSPSHIEPGNVTVDELRLLVDHTATEGFIDSLENDMLQAAVALSDVRVREIMTPRVDIEWIALTTPRDEVTAAARATRRRRLIVCDGEVDNVIGTLLVRDLLLDDRTSVRRLMRPALFLPEQAHLLQGLQQLQEHGTQLAVVVDEFGGTAGIITVENIVETIVGDLPDYDAPRPTPISERIDENTYRLSGHVSARNWFERFGMAAYDRKVDTLAGLIAARLGRWPRVGDAVHVRNLTLTVERMKSNRIDTVLVKRNGVGSSDSDAGGDRAAREREGAGA